ncbi:MAG TPA: hypothetical protein VE291_10875 [Terracidiphilus sp.]|jgi:hypothetical protein|nr:hypothetical protein [Terracidiphilus sp.]
MRQEVYRVAFDEASAELSEILTRFELMRLRKDRLEKVVEALKPLIAAAAEAAPPMPSPSVERAPAPVMPVPSLVPAPAAAPPVFEYAAAAVAPQAPPPAPGPIPYPVQQAAEETGDPFTRRVENAIGLGSSARDVREYSRLFNTGSSRQS